ncbi:MAG: DUF2726 domain-containing protein [Candidatus Moranbacteria bacterium]|nr:DUF2726 domain-containing protein [Candidatus Moranbacteria bacterium]
MNDSELAFFVNLRRTLGEEYLVFPKVRVEDFVEVKEAGLMYGRKQGLRNRIKSNHVDFLICDRVTTAPLLSIELDGRSHRRADRMKRDVFVVELYKSVGLPFYRVKVGSDFYAETEAIGSILREKTGAVSVENNKTRPEISK